jgi:hypothetical protein
VPSEALPILAAMAADTQANGGGGVGMMGGQHGAVGGSVTPGSGASGTKSGGAVNTPPTADVVTALIMALNATHFA